MQYQIYCFRLVIIISHLFPAYILCTMTGILRTTTRNEALPSSLDGKTTKLSSLPEPYPQITASNHHKLQITLLLGGEANQFDRNVEERGVQEIIDQLDESVRQQILSKTDNDDHDVTIPIRFFRVEKGNVKKAMNRIHKTIKWREEIGIRNIIQCLHSKQPVEELTPEQQELRKMLMAEVNTGYLYIRGYDQDGRALVCTNPKVSQTGNDPKYMFWYHLYTFERAIACTKRKSIEIKKQQQQQGNQENAGNPCLSSETLMPLEQFIVVGDYNGFCAHHRLPISLLKDIFTALNDHYPERLYCAYSFNPNLILRAVLSLCKQCLDPVTRQKIVSCSKQCHWDAFTSTLNENEKNTKIEPCYLYMPNSSIKTTTPSDGKSNTLRSFDPIEYMNLPFNFAFDE